MKGFVITIVSVSLILLLVLLSSSLRNSHLSMERALTEPQALSYAAFLFDDVAEDVNSIAGPEITLMETNSSMNIQIKDSIPKENYSGELSDYEGFLETKIANQTHAYIDANFSNMSSGAVLVSINEDYTYENDPATGEMLFTSQGGTGATSYYITVMVSETRQNFTSFDFNENGDLNVTIEYKDLNGSLTETGKLFSDVPNSLDVVYADNSSLYIDIGKKDGNDGSLWIKAENTTASVDWYVTLPPIDSTKRIGYAYDATMEYVQGGVKVSRRIGS